MSVEKLTSFDQDLDQRQILAPEMLKPHICQVFKGIMKVRLPNGTWTVIRELKKQGRKDEALEIWREQKVGLYRRKNGLQGDMGVDALLKDSLLGVLLARNNVELAAYSIACINLLEGKQEIDSKTKLDAITWIYDNNPTSHILIEDRYEKIRVKVDPLLNRIRQTRPQNFS